MTPTFGERVRIGGRLGLRRLVMAGGDPDDLVRFWPLRARPEQCAPGGDWSAWLVMAGRGFGKTRAGAEWVHNVARAHPGVHIAVVGTTMAEARAVMVEGESGLIATARRADQLLWAPSLDRLRWGNGTQARLFSASDPEGLRGPQHGFAWADEIGKWPYETRGWDNLMLTLRAGARPRVLATTTPRQTILLRRLLADPRTVVTRGRTHDNAANLSPAFIAEMEAQYGGTRLGRQELDGELIEDVAGALWSRGMVEGCRVAARPRDLVRIVVAVDPPASATGDACGIVACGVDAGGIGYVLDDASVSGASPQVWARAVAGCAARWGADRVIAEGNNGGDMVRTTLTTHDPTLPVRLVHASRGKGARAEPVALLYEEGRVKHCGALPALEDQLCGLTVGGYEGPGRSPDRADALVWALTELMLKRRAAPRVRGL